MGRTDNDGRLSRRGPLVEGGGGGCGLLMLKDELSRTLRSDVRSRSSSILRVFFRDSFRMCTETEPGPSWGEDGEVNRLDLLSPELIFSSHWLRGR